MTPYRQIVKRLLGRVLPADRLLVQGDTRRAPPASLIGQRTTISLTFDDGPHPQWTEPVLDALDDAGWKATFFVVGREAAAWPHLVQQIVERGHELGNHTYHHAEPRTTDARQLIDEVRETEQLLSQLTGQQASLMRPPKGSVNLGKLKALWKANQTVVLWNVDTKDFAMSSDEQAKDWSRNYSPRTGDVVLLHDRLPYAARIVRELAESHGSRLISVPVSQWIGSQQRPLSAVPVC